VIFLLPDTVWCRCRFRSCSWSWTGVIRL